MTVSKYNFPSPIRANTFRINDFLGVDFTTFESEVNTRRSPDAVNLIAGYQGSVDKRYGTEIIKKFEGKIWSIYYDRFIDGKSDIQTIIVHEGTRLWVWDSFNNVWSRVQQWVHLVGNVDLELQERKTNFLLITPGNKSNSHSTKLIQNNWSDSRSDDVLILFHSALYGTPMTFSTMVYNIGKNKSGTVLQGYEMWFKFPTTSIARTPNGNGTSYESSNKMTGYRRNDFLSDVSSVEYVLDWTFGHMGWIEQMQADGSFSTSLHGTTGTTITYTVDKPNKKIIFNAVPHATYKTGVDNIRIYFSSNATHNDSFYASDIHQFTNFARFGIGNDEDYVFMCNPDGNYYSGNKEICVLLESRMYYNDNFTQYLGSQKKIGYSKLGEYLVVHAEKFGSDPTMYLRTANLDNNGELYFSNKAGGSNVGAIAPESFANLRDDPLWLSEAGVNAVLIDNVTRVQSVQDRGFYITQKLLEEPNLDKSVGFVFDNKYFLCVNNHVYVADSRRKSIENKSYSESFQYDWYYLDGFDIQSYAVFENVLYFGTTDGRLMKYKNSESNYPYCDEVIGTETTWANATTYTLGQLVKDSGTPTKYYICIKPHTSDSIVRPLTDENYWNEITKGTDRFYVPIIAYWTTPIMNMGDITARKTLKNLWVRLEKFTHTGVRIYYSTQGLVKKRYDGIFDFSNLDFSRFTFSTDTDPMVVVTNRQERKFMSIQFKIESRDNTPMSLLEIVGKYTINNQYKG